MTFPSKAHKTDTAAIVSAFAPIIGLSCWGAKRIYGSIVALEFGRVVAPPKPSITSVKRAAANPSANIPITFTPPGGEWNFTLTDAGWTIRSTDLVATDNSTVHSIEKVLAEVNGQYLRSAEWTPNDHLIFNFHEGASIEAGPSTHHEPDNHMWWLMHTNIECVSVDGHGMLTTEIYTAKR